MPPNSPEPALLETWTATRTSSFVVFVFFFGGNSVSDSSSVLSTMRSMAELEVGSGWNSSSLVRLELSRNASFGLLPKGTSSALEGIGASKSLFNGRAWSDVGLLCQLPLNVFGFSGTKPTGEVRRLPFTVAVIKEDETWGAEGTIAAVMIWYRAMLPRASSSRVEILEETIETVGPEANGYVVLLEYIS